MKVCTEIGCGVSSVLLIKYGGQLEFINRCLCKQSSDISKKVVQGYALKTGIIPGLVIWKKGNMDYR